MYLHASGLLPIQVSHAPPLPPSPPPLPLIHPIIHLLTHLFNTHHVRVRTATSSICSPYTCQTDFFGNKYSISCGAPGTQVSTGTVTAILGSCTGGSVTTTVYPVNQCIVDGVNSRMATAYTSTSGTTYAFMWYYSKSTTCTNTGR